MDDLTLVVGGQRYRGWESVRITRSLEHGPDQFELTVSHRWRDRGYQALQPGQAVTVMLGNERVTTGYLDEVQPDYNEHQAELQISGRSRLADLVDCAPRPRQFQQRTLLQVAQSLCAPFGITVRAVTDIGGPFASLVLDEGQPVWELLEYAARIRAVRLMGDTAGDLLITRAGTERAAAALKLGENIQSGHGRHSWRDRFSEYTVVGGNQSSTAGTVSSAADTAHPTGTATDSAITRYRPLVITSAAVVDSADCHRYARWQRNTHFGRGHEITYTVSGWRAYPGAVLWAPNQRVSVRDPCQGIEGDWLIAETSMVLDDKGTRTDITVMPPEAFALVELPEPTAAAGAL